MDYARHDFRKRHTYEDDPGNDRPPMSRLFIICNKALNEEDFREAFSPYGDIEDIWVVKDKYTHQNKGIAYVKFSRTSEAAKAQEEMNGKTIGGLDRTLKVLVAANRSEGSNKSENEHEKYLRLFIVVPKTATEEDIREEFAQWGNVHSVVLVKEKDGSSKGFAYVRFTKFYYAAVAFEKCSPNYRPKFAEPKRSSRRDQYGRYADDSGYGRPGPGFSRKRNNSNDSYNNDLKLSSNEEMSAFLRMQNVPVPQPTALEVTASNYADQDQLWRLFDIIPGLDCCQIRGENGPGTNEVLVVYDNPEAAIYAKDKLHGMEYPMGEPISVKVDGLSTDRMDTTFIDKRTRKSALCNVPLPPTQPMARYNARVAQRLFIVISANLPVAILKNVFSCWRGLIDVYLLPNKNCGYVKYAERESAQKAIKCLHLAEICGTRIKVMEAEERNLSDGDDNGRKRYRRN